MCMSSTSSKINRPEGRRGGGKANAQAPLMLPNPYTPTELHWNHIKSILWDIYYAALFRT